MPEILDTLYIFLAYLNVSFVSFPLSKCADSMAKVDVMEVILRRRSIRDQNRDEKQLLIMLRRETR